MKSREIRQQFLDFFRSKGHAIVPSSPVVPHDDPTLMFANAGMNQFKDVFLGTGSRPYRRAANTQKCIRAGGKHNDLDDVGHDTYHHTFFEMLGNWSFGDYFKKEAIAWAWELLTEVWGIDRARLHATYFQGDAAEGLEPDHEARDLWLGVPGMSADRVHPGNKKDNFWEMGDTGPCGPCSEIHIDLTEDKSGGRLVNAGDARVIEIWNLVFIQYNRGADGKLTPLPAKHVDTGMGFERLCAVLQRKRSNYDTDVFAPLFAAIQQVTGAPAYAGRLESGTRDPAVMVDVAYRVIADHARCLTFALTDGAVPSNEGRGYVLRRILRRAVRYGRQYLAVHRPFLCDLVPAVVETMGAAFPELRTAHGAKNAERVAEMIREEEQSFIKTLDRGIELFEKEYKAVLASSPTRPSRDGHRTFASVTVENATGNWRLSVTQEYGSNAQPSEIYEPLQLTPATLEQVYERLPVISGRVAFALHDTYGFPIDLTRVMAEERGLTVDMAEYERLLAVARDTARGCMGDQSGKLQQEEKDAQDRLRRLPVGACDDSPKYNEWRECQARITSFARMTDAHGTDSAKEGQEIVFSTDRTCFYVEQGGQVSDTGSVATNTGQIEVSRVSRHSVPIDERVVDFVSHRGVVTRGEILPGQSCTMSISAERRVPIMQNHTATHLLNWALREVLGEGVQQKGSLVDPEKTRFDFSHSKPLSAEEATRVERLVNEQIAARLPVFTKEVAQAEARRINTLRAVFGEKYADVVRVVSVGADVDEMLRDPQNPKWLKHAVEFCGGTHLANSGEAEHFVLVSEEGVAKGIRRVVGITGPVARRAEAAGTGLLNQVKNLAAAPPPDLGERLTAIQRELVETVIPLRVRHELQAQFSELQKLAKAADKQQAAAAGGAVMDRMADLLASATTIGGVTVVVGEVPPAGGDALRGAIDWVRNKTAASAVLLATSEGGKVTLIAGMSKEAVAKGLKAGDLIRELAPLVGGKGGGRPDMAQGGGDRAEAIPSALQKATELIKSRL